MNAAAEIGLCDEEDIDLLGAALELAALDHPTRNPQAYLDCLDVWTERLMHLGQFAADPVAQAQALAQLLAQEQGLSGDVEHYDAPENANLMDVLDRKRGLPVSLSMIYAAFAWRLGWQADMIDIGGHVLMRIGAPEEGLLMDPFADGRILEGEDIQLLIATHGHAMATDLDFTPLSQRAALVRLLTNQATRAAAGGQMQRALALYERMTALAPGYSALWWERARLEQMLGLRRQARASLAAMGETTRDPRLLARLRAALDALARTIN